MRLDPEKCPVGTVGYLPPFTGFEFNDADDFDWFKSPSVVLGEDRCWRSIEKDDETGEANVLMPETPVFADWKSAVRYVIQRERADAQAEIEEARKTIAQADAVEKWLNETM